MQLFYRKNGNGDPLIILHGLFGSGLNWNSFSKQFGNHYEVFLLDQRNHGRSPHDDLFNYEVMAEDVAQFFTDHQIEKASVIGHSMGAKTALIFSLNYPLLVDKLIAVDMGIKEYPVLDESMKHGLLSLDFDLIGSRNEADIKLQQYIPDSGTRAFIMQNLYWKKEKKLGWRMNVNAIIASIDEIGKEIEVNQPYHGHTLFVKGADSNYVIPSDYPAILKAFPNASIEEIPNAGHWVHADNPTVFGEVAMQFLKLRNQ